jgi:hypothetical protein
MAEATASPTAPLPNLGEVFARLLAGVEESQRPLLIAIAERLAAERYRVWAKQPAMSAHAAALRACAEREDAIAGRVEALFPDAAAVQRELLAKHPDLADVNRAIFAGRPLGTQFRIQAQGERLGAATWRSFAKRDTNAAARATYLACAELEEASAVVLEALL